jgi:uncharacterized protein YjiS (DUF1127 family)
MINKRSAYRIQFQPIGRAEPWPTRTTIMNALIHSFDRIEPPPPRSWLPRFVIRAWSSLSAALRESRDRRALTYLSEWNEHMLRDVGLTRDDVRRRPTISDSRWLIDNSRLGER